MTRLLAFSDIHNNVSCVEILRAQEGNDYDALLIAGDIGSERFDDILRIANSFGCPVFYVYGNWDNQSEYSINGGAPDGLVHHTVHDVGDIRLTGYSGCIAHWGMNPAYRDLLADIENRHRAIAHRYETLKSDLDHEAEATKAKTRREAASRIEELSARTPDRRKSSYRQSLRRINERTSAKLEKARSARAVALERFRKTPDYQAYLAEKKGARMRAVDLNREKLDERLAELEPRNTIVMTHERLFRLDEGKAPPLLHLFGHRHTYKHSFFKGTHFLNVAALDERRTAIALDDDNPHPIRHVVNCGGYCIITLSGESVSVERRQLLYDGERWRPASWYEHGADPVPEAVEYARAESPYRCGCDRP